MRDASFRNKKASATNFFVTEAVKNEFIAVPLRFITHWVKQPFAVNGGFPQNDTCPVLKKAAFPFRARRVHFTVLKQVNSQLLSTSLVLKVFGYFSRSSHL
jgi:hypothetical protein